MSETYLKLHCFLRHFPTFYNWIQCKCSSGWKIWQQWWNKLWFLFKLVRWWYYLSFRGGCPLALLPCIQTQMKKLIIPNHSSHFIMPWHALRTSRVLRTTFDVPDHIDRKPVISEDVCTLHSFWKCQTSNSEQYTLKLWTFVAA